MELNRKLSDFWKKIRTKSLSLKETKFSPLTLIMFILVTALAGILIIYFSEARKRVVTDNTAPTVTSVSPAIGDTDIGLEANPTITFSEQVKNVNNQNIMLKKVADNTGVTSAVSYDSIAHRAMIIPASPLAANTAYFYYVSANITDNSGNSFVVWDSTTKANHSFETGEGTTASLFPIASTNATLPVFKEPTGSPYDVTQHGVKPNDGLDDTSAVQSVVNNIPAGYFAYFPAGSYIFKNISLKSNTTVVMSQQANVTIPSTSVQADAFIRIEGSSSGPSYVANVTFIGGSFSIPAGNKIQFLRTYYADTVYISHVKTVGPMGTYGQGDVFAIMFSKNVHTRNLDVTGGENGIAYTDSTNSDVAYSTFKQTGLDGVLVYHNTSNILVDHNAIDGYNLSVTEGRAGIHCYKSSSCNFTNNRVLNSHGNATGIRFRDSEVFVARGNYVENSAGGSAIGLVRIGDWNLDGGNGTIESNIIVTAGYKGIYVLSVKDANGTELIKPVKIINNKISKVYRTTSTTSIGDPDGIEVLNAGSSVTNNTITDCGGHGIVYRSGVALSGNTVTNCAKGATLID